MPGLIKPAPWALTPALFDPEWGWFWRHASIALNMEETQTAKIRNWAFPVQKWEKAGPGPSLVLGVGPKGRFIGGANTGLDISVLAPKSGDPDPPLGDDVSIFIAAENLGAAQGGLGTIIEAKSSGNDIRIPASELVEIAVAGAARHTSTGTVPTTGPFSIGIYFSRGGPLTVYIDGKEDSETASSPDFGTWLPITEIFGSTVGFGNRDIELYCFYSFNNYRLSAAQFNQLHADPPGPFRMLDEVGVVIVPAAGGVTLPIFDNHYRSMRAA